jgi:hypothetical protein
MRVLLLMSFFLAGLVIVGNCQDTYAKRKAEIFPAFKFSVMGTSARDEWQKELARFAEAGKGYVSSRLSFGCMLRKVIHDIRSIP